jgi:predicted transcriptional regulator
MSGKKGCNALTIEEKKKISALIALGKTPNAVAKEIGRNPKTVRKYAQLPEAQGEIANAKTILADEYEDLARRMIDSISDEDIKKINAYQRTLSSGIATDKMRLLREQATSNVGLIGVLKLVEENVNKGKSIEDIK